MPWCTYQGAGKIDQVTYFTATEVQFQNLKKKKIKKYIFNPFPTVKKEMITFKIQTEI